MDIRFDAAKLEQDQGLWLKIKVSPDSYYNARQLVYNGIDKKHVAEIKPYRNKRSTMANGYCWKLCDMIADALRSTKEEVYRKAIREVGVFDPVYTIPEAAEHFINIWENRGTGWIAEDMGATPNGTREVFCYSGSSAYNTKEMSRLIDWLIEEAKGLGITTATPEEVARMKDLWSENEQIKSNRHTADGKTKSMGA